METNRDTKDYYGYLFQRETSKRPTKILDALLRSLANYIKENIGDRTDKFLTPTKLAAFYKSVGGNYDALFLEKSPESIAHIYDTIGCQYTSLGGWNDDYHISNNPTLTVKGFVRWQSIELLFHPEEHVPFMQRAVRNFALRNPDDGQLFPKELPRESFPLVPEPEIQGWYAAQIMGSLGAETDEETGVGRKRGKSMQDQTTNKATNAQFHDSTSSHDDSMLESQGVLPARRTSIDNSSEASYASSIASTADSILSIASASSMSSVVGRNAGSERLIFLLRDDSALGSLFLDGLIRMNPLRFERNLRNLLKKLAFDLRKEATTIAQKGVANFIRYHSRNSAHVICNQTGASPEVLKNKLSRTLSPASILEPKDDIFEDDLSEDESNPEDGDPPFDSELELFVKNSSAFEEFRKNLRRFIHPSSQKKNKKLNEDDEIEQSLKKPPSLTEDSIKNSTGELILSNSQFEEKPPELNEKEKFKRRVKEAVKASDMRYITFAKYIILLVLKELFRWEPKVPDGYTRVRWKCNCGRSLYDDYIELQEGGCHRLEQLLQANNSNETSQNKRGIVLGVLDMFYQQAKSLQRRVGYGNKDLLPQHELQAPISTEPAGNTPNTIAMDVLYLMICHNDGLYATKLQQLDLCRIKTDTALFLNIRQIHQDLRGRLLSLFSFRTVINIKFVQFELFENQLVDIMKHDDVPPQESEGLEYLYEPRPPKRRPPLERNLLMHLFSYPIHAGEGTTCLERFPKKLRERLQISQTTGSGVGWGLQLEESWDQRKAWCWAFFIFVFGSGIAAILYKVFEHNVQNAFAIAGYMVTLATLSIGFLQAMVEVP